MTSNSAPLFDNAIEGDQMRTSSSDVSSSTTGKRPTSKEGVEISNFELDYY